MGKVTEPIFLGKNGKYLSNAMYIFFHLLTGIILGFLLSDVLNDRRWLIPCAVGAILPDLIDKPLGYFLFPVTNGYGRIYSHTILVAILVLAVGLAIWKIKKDPGLMGLGVGILSHQILDLMWREPANWYYPLLGPFQGSMAFDHYVILLAQELTNPSEVILATIMVTGFLVVIVHRKISPGITRNRRAVFVTITAAAFLLCVLSGIIIGWGMAKHTLPVIGWSRPEEFMIGGIVIALAAVMVWRWRNILCTT
jgi:hypothetical protein